MSYSKTSIFPLLLLMVGVAVSRHILHGGKEDDNETLNPIVTRSRQRKICAELCMAGLGGNPCGEDCVDLVPTDMPVQFHQENSTINYSIHTRHGACDLLCDNNLGYPLCGCSFDSTKTTDFERVCRFYCLEYDYQIFGCQKCSVYNFSSAGPFSMQSLVADNHPVDWNLWCNNRCAENQGGAACSCDMLPMALQV